MKTQGLRPVINETSSLQENRTFLNCKGICTIKAKDFFKKLILFFCFSAGDLSVYKYTQKNPSAKCVLLIDAGYSFTHIVPYIKGKKQKTGIKRIDVGGKLLTNHLKEIISYRYVNGFSATLMSSSSSP